ncbi:MULTISPECIES: hypothetical protein [Dehalococcoides]|jgi:hypothetical protein|uniref:Uncharacterized protein n=1 Tax=Dehalococcoides mccartyi TaxID=61435 RepID=A0A142VBE9_9CHLR|nr:MULTISPECIES: hypothetical protein [Dehalococcoides]AII58438.1 hypothetical protein X792_07050 [Dehalococcoides mccartyi CG1]AMU87154.1 hypothetical protein Dm11a5_1328 [Dehalococcoides mccartyi]QBX64449.1 hypothetical protein DhcFL2_06785 [Dehalococcoides mccartyi]BAQ35209.1 hypothetical protein UCH007_12510 [Dehalococcoides sp. UCH007]BAZ97878.1 hypothetical protein DEHALATV1_1250 [Dehalococcoides mccartyi]
MPERLPCQEKDSLTGIPCTYTLSANSDKSEVDQLMIKEFLNALAEVALSVASRGDYQND